MMGLSGWAAFFAGNREGKACNENFGRTTPVFMAGKLGQL
jgi:hypothetical protein